MQSRIHQINPPCQPPNFALVGRDAAGIGAVVFYEEMDGPGQVEIHLAAVAQRFRRRGGGWADEMLSTLLDTLTTRALEQGIDLVDVLTWIDESIGQVRAWGAGLACDRLAWTTERHCNVGPSPCLWVAPRSIDSS